ncbi:hypothetical protein ABMA27_004579 [Loxostege sticticalis]|uniref:Uncharacterized protein n=1 Tax=Loxostege sticticalis TaxID=481309 RepID=A0ABR3HPC0_LOXSC
MVMPVSKDLMFIFCVVQCPINMHPYHTRCDMDTMSQRTCDEPLVYTLGYTCGWSRCDCNGDLLLDERSHSCVDYFTCTTELKREPKGRRRVGIFRLSKKLRLPENDDEFPI